MEHRGIQICILLLWVTSMGWLGMTKIAPTLGHKDQPDQRTFRPESSEDVDTQAWTIRWNHRSIGWARSTTRRFTDGQGHVESVVRLENLTARQMLKDMFGTAAIMLRAMDSGGIDDDMQFGCRISTEMNFDAFGRLKRFSSSLDLDSLGELLTTRGSMGDGRLSVDVRTGSAIEGVSLGSFMGNESTNKGTDEDQGVLLSREFEIPADALVADSLLPQSRLTGLDVGQRWTFKAYRAYPPQNPLREMEAQVERSEMLSWAEQVEPVFVVSFRDTSGSSLTAASEPNSWLWVRKDGTVLKQRMRLGNVTIDFLRSESEEKSGDLDS